jgi:hypothetical protein
VRRALLLCVLLAIVAACTGDDDEVLTDTTTSTTAAADPITAEVDWTARRISVDGDIPFDVNFCEGDAPMLCVVDDGSMLGSIELLSYEDVIDDFAAWGNDFYASVEADRRTACPTYELHGDVPTTAPFAGAKGVRYGFTGTVADTVVERVIGVVANDGAGAVHLLVANALAENDEQTCLHKETELPIAAMDAIDPVLLALAAGSSF